MSQIVENSRISIPETIFELFGKSSIRSMKDKVKDVTNGFDKLSVQETEKNKKANLPKLKRHAILDTGRICYCKIDDLSPLYKEFSKDYQGEESTANIRTQSAQASLNKGKFNAKAKLSKYGDEWAEEEELPGYFTSTIDNGPNNTLSPSVRKEVSNAAQRNNKLKGAKKNSK